MQIIDRAEILPLGDYEQVRPHFRARIIEAKRVRRVSVGEHITALFENRDSVLLQIQEMLRTERITNEPAVLHEIETYNELVPGGAQLSLTLFVEVADRETRERLLTDLAGLEERVAIEVDGRAYPARGKRAYAAREDRTTAVHYLKADLSDDAIASIRAGSAKIAVVIAHPRYEHRAELDRVAVKSLAEDLA